MLPPIMLAEKVGHFLRRLDGVGAGLVAAVSGGPDSVALLRALLEQPTPPNPLVIAHLNHQLRGADSDADEEFVRQLHRELTTSSTTRLELRCERRDVAALVHAEHGNLEQVARRVRYDWLADVARVTGVSRVATGHSANDQAETVLHRLLRGAGLKGLRGIAARRELRPGLELVRPLLGVTRDELLAYLRERGQAYRQDASNLDLTRTRNRIRHELLPQLAQYQSNIVAVLNRLAEQAEALYQDTEAEVTKFLAEAELPRAGPLLIFDRQCLAEAPRNLVREAFRRSWEREGWALGGMSFHAWDQLAGLARGELSALDLPGGIQARARARVVQLGPGS